MVTAPGMMVRDTMDNDKQTLDIILSNINMIIIPLGAIYSTLLIVEVASHVVVGNIIESLY